MLNKRFGFTLAEVLIALVVIGIIAAITIPQVSSDTQKQELVQRVKKTYYVLSQLARASIHENGPSRYWYLNADKNATQYYKRYIEPYVHHSYQCTNYSDCGYKTVSPWKRLKGTTYDWNIANVQSTRTFFYLSDGTFVAIRTGDSTTGHYSEPDIIFDINGPKKPNVVGKDVFIAQLNDKKGIVPKGHSSSEAQVNHSCSKSGSGEYCLKKLMMDSWELKPDYPM